MRESSHYQVIFGLGSDFQFVQLDLCCYRDGDGSGFYLIQMTFDHRTADAAMILIIIIT